jgi:hypothetical protein
MHRITDDCYEFVGSPGSILKVIVLIVEVRFGESAVLIIRYGWQHWNTHCHLEFLI